MSLKDASEVRVKNISVSKEAGFTLLETLIAFIILSFSIGAALQVLSLNRQKIVRAEEYSSVVMLVDEIKMQVFLSDLPKRIISGSSKSGFDWQVKPTGQIFDDEVRVFSIEIAKKNSNALPYEFLYSAIHKTDE